VNGVYYEDGTSNGVARYTKSGTSMSLLSWVDGNWYISELGGGAAGSRTPADGDDIDYYISPIVAGSGWGSAASLLRATTHSLHSRLTERTGASLSEAVRRPDPRSEIVPPTTGWVVPITSTTDAQASRGRVCH
jgi:hypothetical protein